MDVILHIGAHRCGSTTFQHYMRQNTAKLAGEGIGFWGPRRTRNGLFSGILNASNVATGRNLHRRAVGRIRMRLAQDAARELRSTVVSDENMLGSVRMNLRAGQLYQAAGERISRYFQAFDGRVSDVVLNIRSLDTYWASALGYGLTRGRHVPDTAHLEQLVKSNRSWRDVITDVACAVPDTRLWVLPFETFAGRPETQLSAVTAINAPKSNSRLWLNATPKLPELREIVGPGRAAQLPEGDGRWQPFEPDQAAALRETYSDDIMWLNGGADGLAWLMDDPEKKWAGSNLPLSDKTRGRRNDNEQRRMERAR